MDEGEVGAGELVEPRGETAMLLEPADQALDDVALLVGAPLHHAWSGLGGELWDDRRDAAAPESVAHRSAGIAAVGEQGPRPAAWAALAGAPHGPGRHQGLERRLLVALAGGQDEGDGSAAPLAAQVQLAAEAMIGSSRSSVSAAAAVRRRPRGRAAECSISRRSFGVAV